jgi:hypothetical protein
VKLLRCKDTAATRSREKSTRRSHPGAVIVRMSDGESEILQARRRGMGWEGARRLGCGDGGEVFPSPGRPLRAGPRHRSARVQPDGISAQTRECGRYHKLEHRRDARTRIFDQFAMHESLADTIVRPRAWNGGSGTRATPRLALRGNGCSKPGNSHQKCGKQRVRKIRLGMPGTEVPAK